MSDDDQTVTLSLNRQTDLSPNRQTDLPGRFWVYDDFTAAEDVPADFNASLVSLGFIRAAIRRSARLWVAMAVAGFLIGAAAYVASPHAAQASTMKAHNVQLAQISHVLRVQRSEA